MVSDDFQATLHMEKTWNRGHTNGIHGENIGCPVSFSARSAVRRGM